MGAVNGERVRLRFSPGDESWELVCIEKVDEKEVVLAKFFTGRKGEPGMLARWAFEQVRITNRA